METRASMEDYAELLGVDEFRLDGDGIEVGLPTGNMHANRGGWVHGGVLTGLLDMALGAAVVTTLKEGEWCATMSLNTEFLRAAKPGEHLIARARVGRRGSLVAFPSGEVVGASGEVLARASGVWAVRKG